MIVYNTQHMTALAIRALRSAGERAIVLGGWAKLSLEGLDGLEDEEVLKEYCKDNVLFMKSAPHELLFPLCKACVHHGGIGTMQASLAAGCPTVITPVFADQFDIAKVLVREGLGVATTRLGLLEWEELGEAIKAVSSGDSKFRTKTLEVAGKMKQEDGCKKIVEFIETFIGEKVRTGVYMKEREEYFERMYEKRMKAGRMNNQQILSQWNSKLAMKHPCVKEWNEKNMKFTAEAMALVDKGKLWYVDGATSLAREGEGLKTAEVGKFKKFAFLAEVGGKGTRLQVRRLRGKGPDGGWITTKVKDKEIVKKVPDASVIFGIQAAEMNDLFADVIAKATGGGEGEAK